MQQLIIFLHAMTFFYYTYTYTIFIHISTHCTVNKGKHQSGFFLSLVINNVSDNNGYCSLILNN